MIDEKIMRAFIDNDIRPEVIVHLGLQCFDEYSWPDPVEEAFEEDFDEVWEAIGIAPPPSDEDEKWAIFEHLVDHSKTGFLVKFATPALSSSASGWGSSITQWIYADTFEQACEKAIKWQRAYAEWIIKNGYR